MAMKAIVTVFLFLSLFGLNTSLYRKHYYVDERKQWSSAQQYCQTHHDDLSTVSNEELQQLSDNSQVTGDYWIGLYRDATDPTLWKWSGGEDATDVKWDRGEPDTLYEQCGKVKKSSSKVHDAYCSWSLPFYCMGVFELIVVKQENTWEEALEYCRQNYIDLASLSSDVIMKEAEDKSTALTDDVWIGLRFIAGHWFWLNGEGLDYKVWSAGGELQCPAMDQRCGVYDVKKKVWKPADCEQRLNFLCVKKTVG
ncbi:lymphocyte antigen 75-like [Rhinichthys klamathensis goyatoka]|uniref:lymphocyte antigen 75-like n=1 Tax=Rhinichthys klamathensis goyatoka TaxID=3034132 RepID=UPI0024B49321|nr:lymphocyte antigen 75-like [Rhinichthys klamathensis goyatoka]